MSPRRRWSVTGLLAGLSLFAACGLAWSAAAIQYTFVDLGPYFVTAIARDDDRVVGFTLIGEQESTYHAVELWPTPYRLSTETSHAYATAFGQIVGTKGTHAVLWGGGVATDLGLRRATDWNSTASCVNAAGDVWGAGRATDQGVDLPLIWPQGGTARELTTLRGRGGSVYACNDRGAAAGVSYTIAGQPVCTVWSRLTAGGIESCALPDSVQSGARAMNNAGQLVAFTWGQAFNDGVLSSYLWQAGHVTMLRELPGDIDTYATGINDHGDIVGTSCNSNTRGYADPCRAVLWTGDTPTEVFPRVQGTQPQGWRHMWPIGISNRGLIAGSGVLSEQQRAWLLLPAAPALAQTVTGDLNGDGTPDEAGITTDGYVWVHITGEP